MPGLAMVAAAEAAALLLQVVPVAVITEAALDAMMVAVVVAEVAGNAGLCYTFQTIPATAVATSPSLTTPSCRLIRAAA